MNSDSITLLLSFVLTGLACAVDFWLVALPSSGAGRAVATIRGRSVTVHRWLLMYLVSLLPFTILTVFAYLTGPFYIHPFLAVLLVLFCAGATVIGVRNVHQSNIWTRKLAEKLAAKADKRGPGGAL